MKLRRLGYYWWMGGQMGQQGGHWMMDVMTWSVMFAKGEERQNISRGFDCSLRGYPDVLRAKQGLWSRTRTMPLEPQKHWSLSIEVAPGSIGSWIEIRLQRQSPYWLSYCLATEDNTVVHDEQCSAEPFHFMLATNLLVHKIQDINCGKLTDLLKK